MRTPPKHIITISIEQRDAGDTRKILDGERTNDFKQEKEAADKGEIDEVPKEGDEDRRHAADHESEERDICIYMYIYKN